jgi:hypothetical protein
MPVLKEPNMGDATAMMNELMKLMTERSNEQLKSSMADIKFDQKDMQARQKEMAKNMEEALKKMESAKKWGLFAKIGGWVATALTVALAAATGGLAAPLVAVAAVGMQVLQATGQLEKLTELVASGLEKLGVPKAAAQGWAEVIMAVGMIAVTLGASGAATAVARGVGAAARTVARAVAELVKRLMTAVRSLFSGGGSQVASTVARTASQVAQETAQVATQAVAKSLSATRLKIQTGLKLGMGGVGVEQASTQTAGAVQSYQANQRQADVAEGRSREGYHGTSLRLRLPSHSNIVKPFRYRLLYNPPWCGDSLGGGSTDEWGDRCRRCDPADYTCIRY